MEIRGISSKSREIARNPWKIMEFLENPGIQGIADFRIFLITHGLEPFKLFLFYSRANLFNLAFQLNK